jgi:hypothetical protein
VPSVVIGKARFLAAPLAKVLGGKRTRKVKGDAEALKGAGALSRLEVGKMLSKALEVGSIRSFAFHEFSSTLFLSYCSLVMSKL